MGIGKHKSCHTKQDKGDTTTIIINSLRNPLIQYTDKKELAGGTTTERGYNNKYALQEYAQMNNTRETI